MEKYREIGGCRNFAASGNTSCALPEESAKPTRNNGKQGLALHLRVYLRELDS
jgi:hypothetical protein